MYSPSFGDLIGVYPKGIIHAVGPYHSKHNDWNRLLYHCYLKCITRILAKSKGIGNVSVCSPFISSGVRGVPLLESARVAAEMVRDIETLLSEQDTSMILKFATNEKDAQMIESIAACLLDHRD